MRSLIIHTLGERGDVAASPALVRYATTGAEADQLAAAEALGKAGANDALAPLAGIAANNSGALRDAAKLALARINRPGANEAILAAADSADDRAASVLIESLIQRNASDTTGALLKIAGDSDTPAAVTRATFNTLAAVAPADNLPALIDLMTKQSDGGSRAAAQRAIALVAVNSSDPTGAASSVVSAHGAASGAARIGLAQILGKIGTPNAYTAVAGDLKSGDAKVADAAMRALAAWPNDQPLATLGGLAKTSPSNTQRVLALRGYIRMIGLNTTRPTGETIGHYKAAIEMAQRADEKKLALAGLSGVHTQEALDLARSHIKDPELTEEARQATQNIQRELNRIKRLKELEEERKKALQ
ncbi:MAG: HEAT repeat domain-containing protein [Planctomycetota bacterium]